MYDVMPLFSTPVMIYNTEPVVDEKVLAFCNNLDYTLNEAQNFISTNKHILNEPELADIKREIDKAISIYTHEVLHWVDQEFYVTLSWINKNPPGSSHHQHNHSNSLFSGVFYIQSVNSTIRFAAPRDHLSQGMLKFEPLEYNLWNSPSWRLPVIDNQIVFFPSSTQHSVDINENSVDRISLAFNVFVKGTLGTEQHATKLVL